MDFSWEQRDRFTGLAQVDRDVDIVELIDISGGTGEFVALFEFGDFESFFEEWVGHSVRS
jgi:hypothetical protein